MKPIEFIKLEDLNLEEIKKELSDMVENITKLRETPPEFIDIDDIDIWKDEVKKYPNRLLEIIKLMNREIKERDSNKVF